MVLLDEASQIFELYGLKPSKKAPVLDEPAGELLHLLVKQLLSVDQIAGLTKQSIPEILGVLTELEMRSLATAKAGNPKIHE